MKQNEVKVGGTYIAKVNNRLVTVRVDAIRDWSGVGGGLRYDVTNLSTGRKTTFRSAAKFRRAAVEGENSQNPTRRALSVTKRSTQTTDAGNLSASPTASQCTKPKQSDTIRCRNCEGTGTVDPDPNDPDQYNLCPTCRGRGSVSIQPKTNYPESMKTLNPTGLDDATEREMTEAEKRYDADEEDEQGSDPYTPSKASIAPSTESGKDATVKTAEEEETNSEDECPYGDFQPSLLTGKCRCQGCRKDRRSSNSSRPINFTPTTSKRSKVTNEDERAETGQKISALSSKLRQKQKAEREVSTTRNFSSVAGMKPTEEQRIALETAYELQKGKGGALVLVAGAGCGKTAELRMMEAILIGSGQYTAFNAPLVAESKTKFKKAACNTTHSLAFKAVGKRFAHRMKGNRVLSSQIAYMLGINDLPVDVAGLANPKTLSKSFLASQVSIAIRRFCQSADREITTKHFRYIDGIDIPIEGKRVYTNNEMVKEYLLPFAQRMWEDLSYEKGTLPCSNIIHDVYVKTWQLSTGANKPYIAADYILLDEAQDSAPVMLDILQQQTHALVILVGDSNQSIYGWRGAIDAMKAYPNAPRRLLSQSFRFGQTIADVANSILSTLDEPTDLVMKGLSSIPSRVESVENPTCVLCRTNAGAVSTILRAVEQGKRPHLIGGGSDVVDFVKAAKMLQNGQPTAHPQLCCFSSWTEVQAYVKEDEGEDLKLLVKLIDEFKPDPILNALENMPKEEEADLVASTAHRSKGREWNSVKLAADFPPASKMGDSDRRLLYVAATRAKHQLDISECPAFQPSYEKDSGRERPGLKITYTIEMPSRETLQEYEASKGKKAPSPIIVDVERNKQQVPSENPAPSPNPSKPTELRSSTMATTFTWNKHNDKWVIRGPAEMENKRVTVTRRDGSTSTELLGAVIIKYCDCWLYSLGS